MSEEDNAKELYVKWHSFEPNGVIKVDVPVPKGALTIIGPMTRLDYTSDKWKKNEVYYYHNFRKNPPTLMKDTAGNYFINGFIKVTELGIDDWDTAQPDDLKPRKPCKSVTKLGVLELIMYKDEDGKVHTINFSDRFYVAHPDADWTYIASELFVKKTKKKANPAKHKLCPTCKNKCRYYYRQCRYWCETCKKWFREKENPSSDNAEDILQKKLAEIDEYAMEQRWKREDNREMPITPEWSGEPGVKYQSWQLRAYGQSGSTLNIWYNVLPDSVAFGVDHVERYGGFKDLFSDADEIKDKGGNRKVWIYYKKNGNPDRQKVHDALREAGLPLDAIKEGHPQYEQAKAVLSSNPMEIECSSCGKMVGQSDVQIMEGETLCKECYEALFYKCSECGNLQNIDEADGQQTGLCNECWEEKYYFCDSCNEPQKKSRASDPDKELCNSCFSDRYYICTSCDGVQEISEARDDDGELCNSCYDERYYSCDNCGSTQSRDSADDPNGEYCNDCFSETYYTCDNCGTRQEREEATDENHRYCNRCFDIRYFNCDSCEGVQSRAEAEDPDTSLCNECYVSPLRKIRDLPPPPTHYLPNYPGELVSIYYHTSKEYSYGVSTRYSSTSRMMIETLYDTLSRRTFDRDTYVYSFIKKGDKVLILSKMERFKPKVTPGEYWEDMPDDYVGRIATVKSCDRSEATADFIVITVIDEDGTEYQFSLNEVMKVNEQLPLEYATIPLEDVINRIWDKVKPEVTDLTVQSLSEMPFNVKFVKALPGTVGIDISRGTEEHISGDIEYHAAQKLKMSVESLRNRFLVSGMGVVKDAFTLKNGFTAKPTTPTPSSEHRGVIEAYWRWILRRTERASIGPEVDEDITEEIMHSVIVELTKQILEKATPIETYSDLPNYGYMGYLKQYRDTDNVQNLNFTAEHGSGDPSSLFRDNYVRISGNTGTARALEELCLMYIGKTRHVVAEQAEAVLLPDRNVPVGSRMEIYKYWVTLLEEVKHSPLHPRIFPPDRIKALSTLLPVFENITDSDSASRKVDAFVKVIYNLGTMLGNKNLLRQHTVMFYAETYSNLIYILNESPFRQYVGISSNRVTLGGDNKIAGYLDAVARNALGYPVADMDRMTILPNFRERFGNIIEYSPRAESVEKLYKYWKFLHDEVAKKYDIRISPIIPISVGMLERHEVNPRQLFLNITPLSTSTDRDDMFNAMLHNMAVTLVWHFGAVHPELDDGGVSNYFIEWLETLGSTQWNGNHVELLGSTGISSYLEQMALKALDVDGRSDITEGLGIPTMSGRSVSGLLSHVHGYWNHLYRRVLELLPPEILDQSHPKSNPVETPTTTPPTYRVGDYVKYLDIYYPFEVIEVGDRIRVRALFTPRATPEMHTVSDLDMIKPYQFYLHQQYWATWDNEQRKDFLKALGYTHSEIETLYPLGVTEIGENYDVLTKIFAEMTLRGLLYYLPLSPPRYEINHKVTTVNSPFVHEIVNRGMLGENVTGYGLRRLAERGQGTIRTFEEIDYLPASVQSFTHLHTAKRYWDTWNEVQKLTFMNDLLPLRPDEARDMSKLVTWDTVPRHKHRMIRRHMRKNFLLEEATPRPSADDIETELIAEFEAEITESEEPDDASLDIETAEVRPTTRSRQSRTILPRPEPTPTPTRPTFAVNDRVKKVRAFGGSGRHNYCAYGGDENEVPIGTAGKITLVENANKVRVQFDNGILWFVDTSELDKIGTPAKIHRRWAGLSDKDKKRVLAFLGYSPDQLDYQRWLDDQMKEVNTFLKAWRTLPWGRSEENPMITPDMMVVIADVFTIALGASLARLFISRMKKKDTHTNPKRIRDTEWFIEYDIKHHGYTILNNFIEANDPEGRITSFEERGFKSEILPETKYIFMLYDHKIVGTMVERIKGFVGFGINNYGNIEPSWIITAERFRRTGVSRKLKAFEEKIGKMLGAQRIYSVVKKDNVASVRMLMSLGFKLYREGETVYRFVKQIGDDTEGMPETFEIQLPTEGGEVDEEPHSPS